jgi:peptide deformylase
MDGFGMTVRSIITYPDPFLRQPTAPVAAVTDETRRLIDDMIETMYAEPGVGLAAIQIGVGQSVIVYDDSPSEEERRAEALVNPEILEESGSLLSENEGCLSVPDFRADVQRAARVRVRGLDREGRPVEFEAEGFRAIVLQHEIDHLRGILFIDRISSLKRELYKRRVKKQMKQSA